KTVTVRTVSTATQVTTIRIGIHGQAETATPLARQNRLRMTRRGIARIATPAQVPEPISLRGGPRRRLPAYGVRMDAVKLSAEEPKAASTRLRLRPGAPRDLRSGRGHIGRTSFAEGEDRPPAPDQAVS